MVLSISSINGQADLGIFDNHLDIGDCRHKGFAEYDKQNQVYTIGGSGHNMWFNEDQFHYLWTTIQGDFIVRAKVEFLGKGVDPHRKIGWIVKNDLNSETPHVNATTHGDGLTSMQFRKTIGGNTEQIVAQDSFAEIIQLERKGEEFIMYAANEGLPLKKVGSLNMTMGKQTYIGLYVCAHNADIIEVARFSNVRIVRPAYEDFQPYRDYIGSHLEIMEVASGHRKVLFSTAHSIQAPNWTVNGENLIYNSEGRLFTYNIKQGSINPLNTGFAINNNNDHVLSFDGELMGISHHNSEDDNNSTIYYLPSKGDSLPIMVTRHGVGNSYLHGWTPDRKKMVFTGYRKGQYDIYTVDVKSGEETQLTDNIALDDGPEFSPDGQTVFFNSVRTGKMKLWRMDHNGRNQTQLTFDEYNDWFPHVSPDQKWIVFLSYPSDIDPTDHPFYKPCLLRLMPYNGGEPKVIGYVYGGQGTINVPSWSPDSKYIAFVSRLSP